MITLNVTDYLHSGLGMQEPQTVGDLQLTEQRPNNKAPNPRFHESVDQTRRHRETQKHRQSNWLQKVWSKNNLIIKL